MAGGRKRQRPRLTFLPALFLIFYLVFLLVGAYSSIEYAVMYGQRNRSAWAPLMAPHQDHYGNRRPADAAAGNCDMVQGPGEGERGERYNMSHELIAVLIFSSMMLMLLTGQRVFGAIGGVATLFALTLWGKGWAQRCPSTQPLRC